MSHSTKKQSPVDEETIRDDEIDALLNDSDDQEADATELELEVASLRAQLKEADNARLRAMADYQNLQRRSASDRMAWSKLATQDLVTSILQPLEHLTMAAEQLNDPGLTMVVKQLFERLSEQGLQLVDVIGTAFDPESMEAIEGSNPDGKKVISVIQNGYTLNGVLIQPAKVKVG